MPLSRYLPWSREAKGYRGLATSKSGTGCEKYEERRLLYENGSKSSRSLRPASIEDRERRAHQIDLATPQKWSRRSVPFFIINIILFLSSVALFIALPYRRRNELNYALKQVSTYSPILDNIEIPLVDTRVDGGLFPSEPQLLGRREPSPATDAIWEDYELQLPFALSREEVLKLGKDPDKTVKLPDELFGRGDDTYMGGMDIFHVLHCFDALRQEAFKDYDFDGETYHMEGYGKSFKKPKRTHTEIYWIHLRHCADIVVQNLMCNADAAMITWTWLETQDLPWPDFSVNRKCRDWDALTRWRDENALPVDGIGKMKKPGDQTRIDDMYWMLYGNETVEGDNRHHPLWD